MKTQVWLGVLLRFNCTNFAVFCNSVQNKRLRSLSPLFGPYYESVGRSAKKDERPLYSGTYHSLKLDGMPPWPLRITESGDMLPCVSEDGDTKLEGVEES